MEFAFLNKHKKLFLIGAMSLTVVLVSVPKSNLGSKSTDTATGGNDTWDTYIPAGHVLVPIDVENFESLDDMIDQFGIVDLYVNNKSLGASGAKLLAGQVKLLRSPLNKHQMGVMVPENMAPKIVQAEGPLKVIVKNPNKSQSLAASSAKRKVVVGKPNQ